MSTTDPAASRREKRRRLAGDPGVLAAAIACAALMAASAFVVGLAIGETADMLRDTVINSSFDDREPYPMFWGLGTFGYLWVGGLGGLIGGSAAATHLLDTYRGGERQPRILASLAFCAIAAGVAVNAQTWLEPLEVGTKLDPVFHEDAPWSVFGWIAYYADIWLPALAVTIAATVVVSSVRLQGRLRRQIAERDRLLAEGRRVKGAITEVSIRTSVNDQGQRSIVGAEVTVRFTDGQGVQRWVTRFSRDRAAMPGTGFVEVLFDPQRPGVEDLIFVSFQRDPAPAEWIGTVR
ncbi:hypothetical protein [Glycomyces harbinensis]|uniref:Uncharacterized protein n=1 Tax=Glycomyces harbinensis TaxID=58114 RepID=A0A1G7DXF6_9ACTN|nr:hypothetical protein [Glycomyces harbinensis]SDE56184.1 hypothetical protein SAMN05216270_1309 [Glycomyces harbinensis]